jgi:transposase
MSKRGRAPRRYAAEFKAAAVQRVREAMARGETQSSVARMLDVGSGVLARWVQEAAAQLDAPRDEPLEAEVRRLRREVETLRLERDFAKKAAAYFAREVP